VEEILTSLLNLHNKKNNFEVLFACDDQKVLDANKKSNVTLIYTQSFEDYNAAINSVDILVFNYSELDYKIRHSGVITDSICRGKIVIAPDFPIFKGQLSTPERVGLILKI
jgi:adenine deaminase